MKDFDTYSIYNEDKPLFKKLGLQPFEEITNWETVQVGQVKTEHYSINLFVMGCSAQFWTAEIFTEESNEHLKVTTGSGCLSTFWNSIELIAQGMIRIEISAKNN